MNRRLKGLVIEAGGTFPLMAMRLRAENQHKLACWRLRELRGLTWRQEHAATHARGLKAEQAGKLEARLLFPRSQGRTLARAGGSACAPLSAHHGIPSWTSSERRMASPMND